MMVDDVPICRDKRNIFESSRCVVLQKLVKRMSSRDEGYMTWYKRNVK